ncbi:MAG: sulfite exporter TauE/SafE family protein [Candidatus Micrarchaeia archaeon]
MHFTPIQHAIVFLISLFASTVSSSTGIGAGILLAPLLFLCANVPLHYAIATSLISAVATSVISSRKYLHSGFVNVRLALFLEAPAVLGAIVGATAAISLPERIISIALGILLFFIFLLMRSESPSGNKRADPNIQMPTSARSNESEKIPNCQLAFPICFFAGVFAGLFGIGGGIFFVPTMNRLMCIPIKRTVATSVFMMGINTCAGALVYTASGYSEMTLFGTALFGVFFGAHLGSAFFKNADEKTVKNIIVLVLFLISIVLLLKGIFYG